MTPGLLFDALLALGLVVVGASALFATTLFKAVVLFIAFGLMMALAWVRLDAPDIALAEAAIGAGLTGALMLDALGHVAGEPAGRRATAASDPDDAPVRAVPRIARLALGAGLGAVVGAVGWAALTFPVPYPGLAAIALDAVAVHPVSNAATVVLLDLRAWDTFLEMLVLLLAALGTLVLKARAIHEPRAIAPALGSEMLDALARRLVPLMLLVAGYLLWAGTARSGGAFPAGAILGAAGVMLFLADIGRDRFADTRGLRIALGSGTAAFLGAGLLSLAGGSAFLDYAPAWTYPTILAIEIVLTLSIGITLALIYGASAREPRSPDPELDAEEAHP